MLQKPLKTALKTNKEQKSSELFGCFKKLMYLCTRFPKESPDPLAQLVEHNTFNVGVLGSSPKRITKTG